MMDLDKIERAMECLRELERLDAMRELNATYLEADGALADTYPPRGLELIREITTLMNELVLGEFRQPCCNALIVFDHVGFPIRALESNRRLDQGLCAVQTNVGRIVIG